MPIDATMSATVVISILKMVTAVAPQKCPPQIQARAYFVESNWAVIRPAPGAGIMKIATSDGTYVRSQRGQTTDPGPNK